MRYSWKKANKAFYTVFLTMMIICLSHISANAASYTPRLSLPADARTSIKEYRVSTSYGWGNYNPYSAFSVGNCTWYAFGRAWEILGYFPEKLIFSGDAEVWFNENKANYDSGNGGFPYSTDRNKPALGAIAVWENTSNVYGEGGHVAVVEQITDNGNGTKTIVTSESAYSSYYFQTIERSTASEGLGWSGKWKFLGYIYLGEYTPELINKYEPEGNVDHIVSRDIVQTINIRGWAFDRDNLDTSLNIDVYIGGEAGSPNAEKHSIRADQLREDLLQYYPGIGSYHGFQTNIATAKTGSQTVFVYASNAGANTSDKLLTASTVQIKGSMLNYNPGKTVPEGVYEIVSAVDQNYEITVENNSDENNRNLHIWRLNNDNNYSKWRLVYVGDGYYKIKNIGSSKCFDVSGGTSSLSANVIQYEDHGGDNQLWRIFSVNDEFVLQPKCAPGACLDLDQNKAQDNQNVSISNEHLNTNQRWLFVPTDTVPIGTVDHIVSEQKAQTINLKGWAYDLADLDENLNILVYVGGEAGDPEAEKHIIKANLLREDILEQNPGVGDHHGFQADIVTTKTGTQPIYVYAANAGKENARKLLGSSTVAIKEGKVYTITYYLDGGVNPAENPVEYSENTIITINDPSKEHYTFVGWYLSENGDDKFDEDKVYSENLNLYARWKKTEYEITFFVNHEINPESEQERWIQKVTYGDPFGDLPVPEWDGHTFTGWFTDTDGGDQITAESIYIGGDSFYAHWEAKEYTLSFEINMEGMENPASRKIRYKEVFGALPACTSDDHTFLGWFDAVDGTRKFTSTSVYNYTTDLTLYAKWEQKEVPHEHSYEDEVTLEPTCTEPGIRTYTCSGCGDSYTEQIPAKGHTAETERSGVKDASCTEKGYTGDILCHDCGTVLEKGTSIPATGHLHRTTRDAREATCTEDGYKGDVWCIDCDTRISEGEAIPALGHEWAAGDVIKEVTCTEAGEQEYTCSRCKEKKTETIPVTGHLGNPLIRFVKGATCTENGYTGDIYCSKCYELITKGTEIPATGHQHTVVRNVREATCLQEGNTGDVYCVDCEELVEAGSVIPKAEHSWDSGTITKEATDTEDGEKTFKCTACGETKKETIPKLKPAPTPAPAPDPILGNLTTLDGAAHALSENGDPSGAAFSILQLKAKKVKNTSITIGWKAVPGATGYVIYAAPCGTKYVKLAEVGGTSFTQSGLKKGTYYKYFVAAHNGHGNIMASSKTIHVATSGGKKGNTKAVKLNKRKAALKKGKTVKLKATLKNGKLKVSKHRKVAFESDNPAVATVSKSGKVKAVGKGTCYVYAYAQNGVFAKCKITVK